MKYQDLVDSIGSSLGVTTPHKSPRPYSLNGKEYDYVAGFNEIGHANAFIAKHKIEHFRYHSLVSSLFYPHLVYFSFADSSTAVKQVPLRQAELDVIRTALVEQVNFYQAIVINENVYYSLHCPDAPDSPSLKAAKEKLNSLEEALKKIQSF